jgi:hypothetical protein
MNSHIPLRKSSFSSGSISSPSPEHANIMHAGASQRSQKAGNEGSVREAPYMQPDADSKPGSMVIPTYDSLLKLHAY